MRAAAALVASLALLAPAVASASPESATAGMVVAKVQRATGDRAIASSITVGPGYARITRDFRANGRNYPGCPVRLPGAPAWRAEYRQASIVCRLAYRTHIVRVAAVYVLWPVRGTSRVNVTARRV